MTGHDALVALTGAGIGLLIGLGALGVYLLLVYRDKRRKARTLREQMAEHGDAIRSRGLKPSVTKWWRS